jgi:hypothetical protein
VGKPNYFGAQTTSGHNLLKVLTMRFLALIKMTPKRKISLGSAAFLLAPAYLIRVQPKRLVGSRMEAAQSVTNAI